MIKKILLVVVGGILLGGCGLQNRVGQENVANDSPMTETAMLGYADFTREAFDMARSEGKTVLIYFEANWCPICREQKPVNESAFAKLMDDNDVMVFVANFNDSEETADDKAIQGELGVVYQHTFIFFKPSGEISYRYTGPMSEEEILSRIEEAKG